MGWNNSGFFGGFFTRKAKGRRNASCKTRLKVEHRLLIEHLETRSLLSAAPIVLTESLSQTSYHQPLTLTAGLPSDATGSVTFKDGSTPLGSSSLVANSNALAFDGSTNYIDLGPTLNFTKTTPFSVSFWENSSSGALQEIIGKGSGFIDHTSPGWTIFNAYGYPGPGRAACLGQRFIPQPAADAGRPANLHRLRPGEFRAGRTAAENTRSAKAARQALL